jgi:penicillin-binding protein 1C
MKRRLVAAGLALALLLGVIVAADRLYPPDLARYQERSLELLDRDGRRLRLYPTSDGMQRLAAMPADIDRRYLDLLLRTEDRRFRAHPGIDPLALLRAGWQWLSRGRIVSGGSTLTMQVARLLEPHRHDLAGKLRDMARALQLERRFGKDEILAIYLTLAPMGGNLEGVRAAALAYFDREPRSLEPEQAALLVALPQHPSKLRPDRAAASQATPAMARRAAPMLAAHLGDRLYAQGRGGAVRTTIDAALQQALEALAQRERRWLGEDANIAAVIIDNDDNGVLAYLGGVDYFGPAGMVDLVRAPRSPGSTLKPFIYGLAFDEAIVTADTLVEDAPLAIGGYLPQNFDHLFHGTVTVREALQQSYNLPAVQLIDRIGPERFVAGLRMAGARLILPAGAAAPGLPVALGGVGLSLGDLAMLYAGLAQGGAAAPLRLERDAPLLPRVPLMTRQAAAAIGAILRGVAPPDGLGSARGRSIAYKTGTSYGFRDALAVGFSPSYTVAVWVGRTEGTPRPGSAGRNTAAPLLFHIFDLLPGEAVGAAPPSEHAPRRPQPHLPPTGSLRASADAGASSLRITYPPPGARLELARQGGEMAPLTLEAAGGAPPYRWAVNGRPLVPPAVGIGAAWHPDGPGFTTISVTDGGERTVSASVRID